MALYEAAQTGQPLSPDALKATKVRQNITFLRDQLIEALQVCDVEPMPVPNGTFDAKTQKAVETVAVAPELEGQIQKVVRIGWTMHGQPFRPTEVVIGKSHS
jgi:molecular chaperone GrpE (heat shock protein)